MLKRIAQYGLAAWLACGIITVPYYARADDNKEYLIKAAFIYNFVKFVEWPDGKAISKQNNIDICVVGDSPMGDTGSVFKAASTNRLTLSLVDEKNWKNASSHCHIVFISDSEEDHLSEILGALRSQPVLTVSDIDNFVERGGMIGFVTHDNKIKITVNTKPVTAAGLHVDAQLLEIALKVIEK